MDSAFDAQSKVRCVALVYEEGGRPFVGTGTLLSHRDGLLVVTAGHVAKGFMAHPTGRAMMIGDRGHPLASTDFDVVEISESDPDLGLLKIRVRRQHFDVVTPIALADIDGAFDFTAGVAAYGMCGFPAEQVKLIRGEVRFHPLTFVSQRDATKTTSSSLILHYPRTIGAARLPDAPGLSGSLIWAFRAPERGKVWVPGPAVAIQHAWNETDRFVRCDPLTLLHEWLT